MPLSKTQIDALTVLAQPDMHLHGSRGFYFLKGEVDGKRFPAQTLIVLKRKGLVEFRRHSITVTRAYITQAGRAALKEMDDA